MKRKNLPKTNDRASLADSALDEMVSLLGGGQPVQHRKPNEALRLALDPSQKMLAIDVGRRRRCRRCRRSRRRRDLLAFVQVESEATSNRRFDVRATESRHLAQELRQLDAVVEQQAELPRVDPLVLGSGAGQVKQVDELLCERTPAESEHSQLEREHPDLSTCPGGVVDVED